MEQYLGLGLLLESGYFDVITTRSSCPFDKFIVQTNVLLPLVTGELLQNTVDVTSVTYKLYNIKI